MAIGDITNVAIGSSGYYAMVTISGLASGGTGFFGLNSLNQVTGAFLTFNVLSDGFDTGGNLLPQGVSRTVYGTWHMRQAAPNESFKSYRLDANSNVVIDVALSDFIYSGDAITVSAQSGMYRVGDTSSLDLTNLAVASIDRGSLPYPTSVVNWSWPSYHLFTGTGFDLRVCAFNRFGRSGETVRAVKFVVQDSAGTTVEKFSHSSEIDSSKPDAVPVVEYIGRFDNTVFRTGSVLTGNVFVYPFVGDLGSVRTSSGGAAQPTFALAPVFNVCDYTGNYGITVAVVNPTTGSALGGAAYDISNFDINNPRAYGTIASGARAIRNFNNTNRGRDDVGGGIIYLQSGDHTWTSGGGAVAMGNVPSCYITVKNFPGYERTGCRIRYGATPYDISDRVKVEGVIITGLSQINFDTIGSVWFDNCIINVTGNLISSSTTFWNITHCQVDNLVPGFRCQSVTRSLPVISRGNTIGPSGLNGTVWCVGNSFIGNLKTGNSRTTAAMFVSTIGGMQSDFSGSQFILAYNRIMGMQHTANGTILLANSEVFESGFAVVQNVFENLYPVGAGASAYQIASDSSTSQVYNAIIWNNVFVGARNNWYYNDNSSTTRWRMGWSVKNNLVDHQNTKNDVFPTANSNRTGAWPCTFGCGFDNNALMSISGVSNSNQFISDFPGLNSYQDGNTTSGTFTGFFAYTDHKASFGGLTGSGQGTYSLTTGTPIRLISGDQPIKYDITGGRRGLMDAAGAYLFFGYTETSGGEGSGSSVISASPTLRYHHGRIYTVNVFS